MATYTANYGLHQWVPEDDFLRTDFNTDFQKIDTAIKTTEEGLRGELTSQASRLDGALASVQQTLRGELSTQVSRLDKALSALDAEKGAWVSGSYTGNQDVVQYNQEAPYQTIALGFTPKAVLIMNANTYVYGGGDYDSWNNQWIFQGFVTQSQAMGNTYTKGKIVSGGFSVNNYMNVNGRSYCYLALK